MKEMLLTKDKKAKLDDKDYYKALPYKWYAFKNKHTWYAKSGKKFNGKQLLLHQFLNPKWKMTDHIDGDGLNNQRSNLRECTNQQNSRNKQKRKNVTSIYKGVSWFHNHQKWHAQIRKDNKTRLYLGHTFFEVVAARIYDYWAKKYFGKFAKINGV